METAWLDGKHVVFGRLPIEKDRPDLRAAKEESERVVKSIELTGDMQGKIKYPKAPTIVSSGKL